MKADRITTSLEVSGAAGAAGVMLGIHFGTLDSRTLEDGRGLVRAGEGPSRPLSVTEVESPVERSLLALVSCPGAGVSLTLGLAALGAADGVDFAFFDGGGGLASRSSFCNSASAAV